MPLLTRCPCGQQLHVNEEHAGQHVRCPTCRAVLVIATPARSARAGGLAHPPDRATEPRIAVPPVQPAAPPSPPGAETSACAPSTPGANGQLGPLRARAGAGALVAWGNRLVQEFKEIGQATFAQAARLLHYGRALYRGWALGRVAAASELALGQRMYDVGLGDVPLRSRLTALDQENGSAPPARRWTQARHDERKGLLRQLATAVMTRTEPLAGAEEEYHRAKEARTALHRQQEAVRELRAGLFPGNAAGWRRMGISSAAVLFVLVLGAVILAHAGRPAAGGDPATAVADGDTRPTPSAGEPRPVTAAPERQELLYEGKPLDTWITRLRDQESEARQEAAEVLARVGKPAVAALTEALKDQHDSVRSQSALILGRIGQAAGSAVPALTEATQDKVIWVRICAASALAAVSTEHTQDAMAVLLDIMKGRPEWGDKEQLHSALALDALARIGPPAVGPLITALGDRRNAFLRRKAATALGKMGPSAKAATQALATATKDEDVFVRIAAALALAKVSPEAAESAVTVLVRILSEPDAPPGLDDAARWDAASALGELGRTARSAVPALMGMTTRNDEVVRNAAGSALKGIYAELKPEERPNPYDEILRPKKPEPGVPTPGGPDLPAGKERTLPAWEELRRVVGGGPRTEEGIRGQQRYLLDNARFLVIEGINALDVFFPPTQEGLLAGQVFLSCRLFTAAEQQQLTALLESRKEGERTVGRFKVRLGTAPDGVGTSLPVFWVQLGFESADANGRRIVHATPSGSSHTFDELFTISRFREVNNLIRSRLEAVLPQKELSERVRTLNNLADRAGYSAAETLAHVERAMDEARRNGLGPATGLSSATNSLAFRIALNKQALQAWQRGTGRP